MPEQNYKHHIRYYTTHHFVFYPVILSCAGISAFLFFAEQGHKHKLLWLAVTGLFLAIAWLSYLVRQHYALINQNRIVRLEMRFRYYTLTHQRFEPLESQLTFGQLAALRFASDEELAGLVQRTLKEKISPDEIKKSIQHWLPDHMRV